MSSSGSMTIRTIALLVVLLAAVALYYYWAQPERPAILIREHFLCNEIGAQCIALGLHPPTSGEYFSSAIGSPLRFVTTWVKNGSGRARISGFTCETRDTILTVQVFSEIRHADSGRYLSPLDRKYKKELVCEPQTRSASLLGSATRGTRFWKKCVVQPLADMSDIPPAHIPEIGFDIPSNVWELDDYWSWLARMTGSRNRFRDGWGHMIRMELGTQGGHTVLIASSAGPDGRWGTKDDMELIRDTKTGKIVKDVPGRPDPYAGLKPNPK